VVEPLSLSILTELSRQDGLDVLGLPRHQEADCPEEGDLNTVGAFGSSPVENVLVEVLELVP
jgi:hypothetical protein